MYATQKLGRPCAARKRHIKKRDFGIGVKQNHSTLAYSIRPLVQTEVLHRLSILILLGKGYGILLFQSYSLSQSLLILILLEGVWFSTVLVLFSFPKSFNLDIARGGMVFYCSSLILFPKVWAKFPVSHL